MKKEILNFQNQSPECCMACYHHYRSYHNYNHNIYLHICFKSLSLYFQQGQTYLQRKHLFSHLHSNHYQLQQSLLYQNNKIFCYKFLKIIFSLRHLSFRTLSASPPTFHRQCTPPPTTSASSNSISFFIICTHCLRVTNTGLCLT